MTKGLGCVSSQAIDGGNVDGVRLGIEWGDRVLEGQDGHGGSRESPPFAGAQTRGEPVEAETGQHAQGKERDNREPGRHADHVEGGQPVPPRARSPAGAAKPA